MNSRFIDDLDVIFVPNEDVIQSYNTCTYYDGWLKEYIKIPAGTRSDGASIPRFLWSQLGHPFSRKVRAAGFLHDYLYQEGMFDREHCDQVLYDALRLGGLSYVEAQAFYMAVRSFGESHYGQGK